MFAATFRKALPTRCRARLWRALPLGLLGLIAVLAGCRGVKDNPERLTLSFLMEARKPDLVDSLHFLHPHDQLHGGEVFDFQVEVNQPAYIYVVSYSEQIESSTLHYASPEGKPWGAENPVSTPVWTTQLIMPNTELPGDKIIYAIASPTPMAQATRDRLHLGNQREPPPDGANGSHRGDDLRKQENKYKVRKEAGATGGAELQFTFSYVP